MEIAKAQMQVARLQQIVEIEFFSAKKKDWWNTVDQNNSIAMIKWKKNQLAAHLNALGVVRLNETFQPPVKSRKYQIVSWPISAVQTETL